MSQNLTKAFDNRRTLLAQYITEGKISKKLEFVGSLEYLRKYTHLEQIPNILIRLLIKVQQRLQNKLKLLIENYSIYQQNFLNTQNRQRTFLPFAEEKLVTQKLNQYIEAILGPKTEQDLKVQKTQTKKSQQQQQQVEEDDDYKFDISKLVARDLATIANNYLIGENRIFLMNHARSINFNFYFRLAQNYIGVTYLRFDDTNPEKECQEFIDNIKIFRIDSFQSYSCIREFCQTRRLCLIDQKRKHASCCFLTKKLLTKQNIGLKMMLGVDKYLNIKGLKTILNSGVLLIEFFKVLNVTANEVHLERLGKDIKPKEFLHWYLEATPGVVSLYDYLFEVDDTKELDDYVKRINPILRLFCANTLMHKDLLNSKPEDKLQFERIGYFNLDFDSKDEKFIWNRTVTTLRLGQDQGYC